MFSSLVLLMNAQFGLQIAFYEIFKPSIIEQYCINKLEPESDCEGACHMSELAQNDTPDNNDPATPENALEFKLKMHEFCLYTLDYSHPYVRALHDIVKGSLEPSLINQFLSEVPEAPPRVA